MAEARPARISVMRLASIVSAVAVVAWVAFVTYSYAGSALETADAGGFVGARDARSELQIILVASAFAAVALGVAGAVSQRVFVVALTVASLAIALWLSITSEQLQGVGAFLFLVIWAWSVGAALLAGLGAGAWRLGPAATIAIAIGLGLAALSFAMLALALLGALTDTLIASVLIGGALSLALQRTSPPRPLSVDPSALLRAGSEGGSEGVPETPSKINRGESPSTGLQLTERVSLVAIAGAALVGFAVCLTPQTNFDALHYHLAMPLIFLDEGRFVERPDIIQSYFPLGLEMAFVPAFRLGGETAANLLHWAFVPLTAAVLWPAGNRFFGRPAGGIAAALFALMPLVIWESTATTSDLALTFYLVAGAYLISIAARQFDGRVTLTAGLLCGLALSFKIVAALYLLPLALVFAATSLFAAWDRFLQFLRAVDELESRTYFELRRLEFCMLTFALGGLIGGAPWLVLRWRQTGNPVFPLFNDVFRSDKWPLVNERFDLDQFGIGTAPADFVSFWWEASVDPSRFGQHTPEWLIGVPLLLSIAAVLLLLRLRHRSAIVWTAAALACVVAWFLLSQYHRYGLPAFAMLSLPAAFAIVEALRLLQANAALRGAVLTLLISIWFGAGTAVALGAFSLTPDGFPTEALLARESPEEFRRRGIPDYTAIAFFDEQTRGTEEAGALLGFPYNYFARNRLYDVIAPAELSPFRRIVESGLELDALASVLVAENIRWLVYDARNPFIAETWPPEWLARTVLSSEFLERYTEVAFEDEGVFVYRIREPGTE